MPAIANELRIWIIIRAAKMVTSQKTGSHPIENILSTDIEFAIIMI